jgi:putative transposase
MVDDPAQYRWSSYRAHALGQRDARLIPRPVDVELAADAAYRALFRAHLIEAALADIRLALNQDQPLGGGRFLAEIERATGVRREALPRGRPRMAGAPDAALPGQLELPL